MIARSHFIQWSLAELVAEVSPHLEVIEASTVMFFPHVPRFWPVALPVANLIGTRWLSRLGGVSIVAARKATAP